MRTLKLTGLGAAALFLAACGSDSEAADGGEAAVPPETAPAVAAEPAASSVDVGSTALGEVLVDGAGWSLYGFTQDVDGTSTCLDACADAWPPVLVDGSDLPAGLDPEVFSVVARPDGTNQLKAGDWPLYGFAGDGTPGDISGQGQGDVWFLVAPDGSLIREAAPAASGYGY